MHSLFPIRAMRLGNIRITADKPPKGANSLSKVTKTTDFLRGFIIPERAISYIVFWVRITSLLGRTVLQIFPILRFFTLPFWNGLSVKWKANRNRTAMTVNQLTTIQSKKERSGSLGRVATDTTLSEIKLWDSVREMRERLVNFRRNHLSMQPGQRKT